MIAAIFATYEEAQALLSASHATELLSTPFRLFAAPATERTPPLLILISGMGPEAAERCTRYALRARGATLILNAGLCGSLSGEIKPGTLHVINHTCAGTLPREGETAPAELDLPFDPDPWPELARHRLVTVAQPVFGGPERERLGRLAELVDMEGHAVACVARQAGIPCLLLKGVSDQADEEGRRQLRQNLARVSEALAGHILRALPALRGGKGSLPRRMLNFIKVEHTVFSLPLLFAGAWIGAGYRWPGTRLLALVALAGLGARGLGMAMNRILDRHLDLLNPRTAGRDLPSGKMSLAQGGLVALASAATYLLACWLLGPACWRLSPIPAIVLVSYSLLKRFTCLCHFGIGLSLALGPLGAFVAVTGHASVSAPALLLAGFTLCWISASDILYALQDLHSDLETGVHSMPVAAGATGARRIAALVHTLAWTCIAALWWHAGHGLVAGFALAATGVTLGLLHVERIPLAFRFFPLSAIAGIAGAAVPLLSTGPR